MIEKLEFLMALAREQHFGRAAEACKVSQPALSIGLKQLEDLLGVLLVERGSRYRGLTPEGERALQWARRIVGDARAMRDEIDELKHGVTGCLRLAAVPTALPMTPMLTGPYRTRHPDVRFTILSRSAQQIARMIENLEVDAGLTYLEDAPLRGINTVALYDEEYRLVTAPDSALADRRTVSWAEVAQVPLCLLTADTQNRHFIDGLLKDAAGEPKPTLESDSVTVLSAHVQTGKWASILPACIADRLDLTDAVRAVPIVKPKASQPIGLIVADREPATPLVRALVAEARLIATTRRAATGAREAVMPTVAVS